MKSILLSSTIIILTFLNSCDNISSTNNDKTTTRKDTINYTNERSLVKLIDSTKPANDTIFLGFRIGMTKSQFKNHIKKLRNEGKSITYSSSNVFSNPFGSFDLGPGYTFKTSISINASGKTITGTGNYFLETGFNKLGKLTQLNILAIEDWDSGINNPQWLESKVIENSDKLNDDKLRQALIDNDILDEYDFIRRKGNVVIYENSLTINYIDYRSLLLELLIKLKEKEIIREKNKDIKF